MLRIYELILLPWVITAIFVFIVLLKINAPYGKFFNNLGGYSLPYKIGWLIQESVSPIVFSYFFIIDNLDKGFVTWMFFSLWIGHYTYRSIIFPFRMGENSSRIPIIIMLSAIFFNSINGFINGYYFSNIGYYHSQYLYNINFLLGLLVFIIGFYINFKSDNILIKLKLKNEGYQIPQGFMYKYISCPNYFGEMIEWLGFAIMTLSLPAFIFFIWTVANLFPRAIATHKWYLKTFKEYPNRKAIIPFIY